MQVKAVTGSPAEPASPLQIAADVSLAPYTTLRVGGPARWFTTATHETQISEAVAFAEERSLPLFVLGGGSNLLVSDAGFPGLVLRIGLKGIGVERQASGNVVHVTAAAGEDWDSLVQFTVERDLQGIECLAGIPGTVGGTPVQNVGAYGQEVAQTLVSAHCFDTAVGQLVTLDAAGFGFAYRTSLLNTTQRGRYIITSVTFALNQGGNPALVFPELQRSFSAASTPSLIQVAERVREIRRRKGMVVDSADSDTRSAGSFFRNPIVPASTFAALAKQEGLPESEIPHWPAPEDAVKLPAAWLLERADFKRGMELGRAGISSKHSLALINRGGATEAEISALRDRIVHAVRERFGIALEQEPVIVA